MADTLLIQVTDSVGNVFQRTFTIPINLPPASAPTFSPVAGTYLGTQNITISTITGSATIFFTTDGSVPTTSSPIYSGPVAVAQNQTINAIATAFNFSQSPVGSASYVIQVASPTFVPIAGTYGSSQSVALSCTTPGSSIFYTLDGSTPTTASTLYSTPITVAATETIKAVASAPNMLLSAVATASYVISIPAATPVISPAAGTYTSAQTCTITDATAGSTIFYTLDGSIPTISSTVYSGAFNVGATETVNAMATAPGFAQSAIATTSYVINLPQAATPTFAPGSGTYTGSQSVTITTATPGATIFYTQNNVNPTTSSTVYTGPVAVNGTQAVRAIATAPNFTQSNVGVANYTIQLPVAATPTFAPGAGTYTGTQSVTISSTTAGAAIFYTTNGTTPTTGSTPYTGPVSVAASETLQAIATASGFQQSAVGSAVYTINTGAGVPGAPTQVTAFTGYPGAVYVRFRPPASVGTSAITSYRATASTGQNATVSSTLIAVAAGSYQQLNRRVDIPGMPAGTPVTVAVQAINASGAGPSSAASNAVTPFAVPSPAYAFAGNQQAGWGYTFSFGSGTAFYGTTPGTPSRVGSHSAPTNPVNAAHNVVEIDGNWAPQPNFNHVDPVSGQGGRFFLNPYTSFIIRIFPTDLSANGMQFRFLKALWVDGVMTSPISGGVLTDSTQSWPAGNILGGSDVLNITSGNITSFGTTGNTATTLTGNTASGGNAGDFFEVEVPDINCGQAVTVGNGGSNPAWGPSTMTANAWNSYVIPLTAFNGGDPNYPQVSGTDILKFGIQSNSAPAASYVCYLCECGFI